MGGHGQSSFPFPRTERGWWVPETSRGVAVKDLPPPPTPLHTAQSHPCLAAGYSCSLPTIPPPQFSMGVCPSTRELPGFAFRMRGPGGEGPREELRGLRQLCTMGACAEAATPSFCLPQQGHSAQLSRSPTGSQTPMRGATLMVPFPQKTPGKQRHRISLAQSIKSSLKFQGPFL